MVYAALLTGIYIAVLLLIIVYDLRERRILNILTIPVTALAIFLAYGQGSQSLYSTLLGASTGFLFFYALFLFGRRLYGSPALGFGDVKLAMLLGAMVGLQHVFFTLALGIIVAGGAAVISIKRQGQLRSGMTMPYGAFMSLAGILMLIWITFL